MAVPRLSTLSGAKITHNFLYMEHVLKFVPTNTFPALLRGALRRRNQFATFSLLRKLQVFLTVCEDEENIINAIAILTEDAKQELIESFHSTFKACLMISYERTETIISKIHTVLISLVICKVESHQGTLLKLAQDQLNTLPDVYVSIESKVLQSALGLIIGQDKTALEFHKLDELFNQYNCMCTAMSYRVVKVMICLFQHCLDENIPLPRSTIDTLDLILDQGVRDNKNCYLFHVGILWSRICLSKQHVTQALSFLDQVDTLRRANKKCSYRNYLYHCQYAYLCATQGDYARAYAHAGQAMNIAFWLFGPENQATQYIEAKRAIYSFQNAKNIGSPLSNELQYLVILARDGEKASQKHYRVASEIQSTIANCFYEMLFNGEDQAAKFYFYRRNTSLAICVQESTLSFIMQEFPSFIFNEAIDKCSRIHGQYHIYTAELKIRFSQFYYGHNMLSKALTAIQRAKTSLESLCACKTHVDCYFLEGKIYFGKQNFELAKSSFEQAIATARMLSYDDSMDFRSILEQQLEVARETFDTGMRRVLQLQIGEWDAKYGDSVQ
jgi:hypothetical protein